MEKIHGVVLFGFAKKGKGPAPGTDHTTGVLLSSNRRMIKKTKRYVKYFLAVVIPIPSRDVVVVPPLMPLEFS